MDSPLETRLCLVCGKGFDAAQFKRSDTPCDPENDFAPCTLDFTTAEALEHWRKVAHEQGRRLKEAAVAAREIEQAATLSQAQKAAGRLVQALETS